MNLDIGDILNDWPYRPGEINVRRIIGKDGREKLQMRLDMGLLQMETVGRPDGRTPHGRKSLLDYYRELADNYARHHGSCLEFQLNEKDCEALRNEAVLYYHRYLAEFVLADFPAVVRDTKHNLAIINFCNDFAEDDRDRLTLRQHVPYILMMNIRARARRAIQASCPKRAAAVIEKGISIIEDFYRSTEQEEIIDLSAELKILKDLYNEIRVATPVSQEIRLEEKLRVALEEERYEEAAILRDKLRSLMHSKHRHK
ncbi:MAG TPA: hypothetical protein PKK48_07145 [Phycisphaerae bacterium]|nr:hypothetical protein [Phycisphaerae bacterium]HPS52815.1 hypothetical protein [Phycisphaerae bacterium]